MAAITVWPIEVDGAHWVVTNMDGREERRGPYPSEAEAEVMASRLAAICRTLLRQPVHIVAPTAAKRRA